MLRAIPDSWLSWNYNVTEDETPVAAIHLNWWREKGVLTIGGATCRVYREFPMSGAFILEADGTILACAEKQSAFRQSFNLEYGGRCYTLRARSAFGRAFVLLDGSSEIGSMVPEGILTRRAAVDLPDCLPLPVKVFVIWLVIILWRREAQAASGGGAT